MLLLERRAHADARPSILGSRTGTAVLDDAKSIPPGATLAVDLCIVDAGAAGIALALQFVGRDTSVLLAESGGLRAEAAT